MNEYLPEIYIGILLVVNLGLLALTGKEEFFTGLQIFMAAGLVVGALK